MISLKFLLRSFLKWDEITIPEGIKPEDTQFASHDKSKQMNDIEQIMKEPDGIFLLRFRSFRERTNLPGTSPSRKSFSDLHSNRGPLPPKKPTKLQITNSRTNYQ